MSPPLRLLLLSAQPESEAPLNADVAHREILDAVERAAGAGRMEVAFGPAARPRDVQRLLNRHRPDIVHFHAHGSARGVLLHADDDRSLAVRPEAMAALLRSARKHVRLVLFGACRSAPLAEAAVTAVDFAVGMIGEVDEKAETTFAAAFYGALCEGTTVQSAFDQALAVVDMHGLRAGFEPRLSVRAGVDPRAGVRGSTLAPPRPIAAVVGLVAALLASMTFVRWRTTTTRAATEDALIPDPLPPPSAAPEASAAPPTTSSVPSLPPPRVTISQDAKTGLVRVHVWAPGKHRAVVQVSYDQLAPATWVELPGDGILRDVPEAQRGRTVWVRAAIKIAHAQSGFSEPHPYFVK